MVKDQIAESFCGNLPSGVSALEWATREIARHAPAARKVAGRPEQLTRGVIARLLCGGMP